MPADERIIDPRVMRDIHDGFFDMERFCQQSLMVENKLGQLVPMQLGPAQRMLYEAIRKQREQRKPVRIVVLKARQVWITTGIAAAFFKETAFERGQHTLVLAQDEITSRNVFSHYKRFAGEYKPFGGLIDQPDYKAVDDKLSWSNGSWVQVKTAGTTTFGRSFTARRVHFSELAYYKDQRSVFASVLGSVPKDPDTVVIAESTANGVGDEFHKLCLQAQEGDSDWELVFFAWWEHPEYSLPLRVADDRFQHSLSREEQEMQRHYGLTLEQLNWRRWVIANELKGDSTLFKQEYPSNPEEAFLSSGRMRFSAAHLEKMPIIRDAVEGELEEQEYGGRRRVVFLPTERGALRVFRKPQEHRAYIIGADVAEGIDVNEGKGNSDPDYCVAQVADRDTGEQVAKWRARVEPAEFGWHLYLLGRWFNWAGIVPEANGPGLACIDELLRLGYPANLIYHRRDQPDSDPYKRVDRIGFKTTTVTRPQIVSLLDQAIREFSYIIHDPNTKQECLTFVIKANGKAEAQTGCHDDEVISSALLMVGIQQMPRTDRSQQRPASRPVPYSYRSRHDMARQDDIPRGRTRRIL